MSGYAEQLGNMESAIWQAKDDQRWNGRDIQRAIDSRSRCNLCSLCADVDVGFVKVEPRGSTSPKIMIVGEAPGYEESRRGEAFIGPAAEWGMSFLRDLNIPLEDVRWTNTTRCFPHNNQLSPRTPEVSETAYCLNYLLDEIEEVQPKVIVALGAYPAQLLCNMWGETITKISGRVFSINIRGKIYQIIPCHHFSADLRSKGKYKASIHRALSIAWALVNKQELPVASHLINSTMEAIAFLDDLIIKFNSGEITKIAFDLEYDTLIALNKEEESNSAFDLRNPNKRIVSANIAWSQHEGHCVLLDHKESLVDYDQVIPHLRAVLELIPIICHGFLKAEGPWCREKIGVVPSLYMDTMLLSYSLFMKTLASGHGLKPLVSKFLGWGDWSIDVDAWLSSQTFENRTYKNIPLEMLERYAAIDAAADWGLCEVLEEKLAREPELVEGLNRRLRASYVLLELESRCPHVDLNYLEYLEKDYPRQLKDAHDKIRSLPIVSQLEEETGTIYNPGSVPQFINVLYSKAGSPILTIKPEPKRNQSFDYRYGNNLYAGQTSFNPESSLFTTSHKKFWIGNRNGEINSEHVEIKNYDVMKQIIEFKKPLRYNHKSPVSITVASPCTDDDTMIKLLRKCLCAPCHGTGRLDLGNKDTIICEACSGSGHQPAYTDVYDIASSNRFYKKISKIISSFIKPIRNFIIPNTNKLVCNYLQHVTDTGRLATRDMSIHGYPYKSDIRRLMISEWKEQGGLILSADESQLEVRVMAALSGDQKIIEVYFTCSNTDCGFIGNDTDCGKCPKCGSKLGGDLHKFTAAQVYNRDIKDVTDDQRRFTKTVVFGILYGKQAASIAEDTGLSEQEADDLIKRFMKRFKGVQLFIEKCHEEFKKNGYTYSATGTKLYFEHFDAEEQWKRNRGERESQNYPIQCSAAEMVIDALMAAWDGMLEMKSCPWETTHDSIEFDIYPGELLQSIAIAKHSMETRAVELNPWMTVPLQADMSIGVRWEGDVKLVEVDGDQLMVEGKRSFFKETLIQLNRTYDVQVDVIKEWKGKPPEEIMSRKGYEGEGSYIDLDMIQAIMRLK